MQTSSKHVLLIAVLAAALAVPASTQLEPDSVPFSLGPLGGSAISIVVHPDDADEILIIRYTEGVFRSTDGGATFGLAPYGNGIAGNVRELYQDPQDADTLWAIQGPNVLRSTDFGANWTTLPLVAEYNDIQSLAVAPTGDDLIALDAFNVYHSPDGGTTWNNVLNVVPFSGAVIVEVVYAPSDATRAYVAVSGAGQGIYRSDTGGAAWANAFSFPSNADSLLVSSTDADTVFVGTNFNGMYVSTDGSATWNPVNDPDISGNSHWFAREPGGALWYATLSSLAYSDDGGSDWQVATAGWPGNTPIPAAMGFDGNGKRYLGCEGGGLNDQSGGGLYSMPAGTPTSWTHIGFLTALINDVAIAGPGGPRVIGIGSGVYSGEQGETVTPTAWVADIGADTRALAIDPDDPTRWISGGVGAFFDNAQVRVHTGNGATANVVYQVFGPGVVTDIQFSPHDSDRLVAGIYPGGFGNEAILRSSNGGNSWIDVPGTVGWATVAVAFDPHTPGTVVQLSENSQWAASANYGQNWTSLQPPWSNSGPAMLLAFDKDQPGVLFRGETGGGLYRSDDGAATWTPLGVTLTTHSDLLQHPQFPNLMWVSDANGRVLVSTDSGDSFQVALDLPLGTNAANLALDTADGSLLIGTTSASTWELPNAAPAIKLGTGTAGTGGVVPRHYLSSGLAQVGSPDFAIAGDGFRGGTTVFLAYGLGQVDVPAFGGTFHVGTLLNVLAFPVGGASGAAGAGSFDIDFALPLDPLLVGFSITTQCGAIDPAVAHPDGIALSNGLEITFHN